MDAPLISDGQAVAIVGAIVAGFGAVAGAIKWGVGRIVKAIDDQTADSKLVRGTLAELRAEVREGRDDIAEIKATIITALANDGGPKKRRTASHPALPAVPRRASTDSDR